MIDDLGESRGICDLQIRKAFFVASVTDDLSRYCVIQQNFGGERGQRDRAVAARRGLIKQKFPKGFRAVTPYLRLTPQPNE